MRKQGEKFREREEGAERGGGERDGDERDGGERDGGEREGEEGVFKSKERRGIS